MTLTKILLSTALIANLAACSGGSSDAPDTQTVEPDSNLSMNDSSLDDSAMADDNMNDDKMDNMAEAERGEVLTRDVMSPTGDKIGTVTLTDLGVDGTEVKLDVSGLEQGTHAMHFHQTGKCVGPDFKSAGGHFNPTNMEHGFDTANGPHAGDMKNIEVGVSGEGIFTVTNDRVSIRNGESDLPPLLDADGSALILHMKADDYTSQPSGAAGARVGCAELTP